MLRLPESNSNQPLRELRQLLDWPVAPGLYSFASQGSGAGPLVFDGRQPMPDNEFPIRAYDHEYGGSREGLSPVTFSSFAKLLERLTHFLRESCHRPRFEVIPEFLAIDPTGAGRSGRTYWLDWAATEKDLAEDKNE